MASKTFAAMKFFSLVLIFSFAIMKTTSGDSDILFDYILPPNFTPDANFFTFTGLRSLIGASPPTTFKLSKASFTEFPALGGQSVSIAVLEFPAGITNPPHTHPRSAELLFLIDGTLQVGFVDTTNKLFNQTLQTGDVFVLPKGLVHFQYNAAANASAVAVSAFESANAVLVSIPSTLFNTSIADNVLSLSFKTDVATIHTIQHLKAGLVTKP